MAANMIAIDTNVVVRYVVQDDADQSRVAQALVDSESVFVSLTVILEAGWVLASRYGYPSRLVAMSLTAFVGLPGVAVEDPWTVRQALDWVAGGLDFADALHLAQARDMDGFATFDRQLAARAAQLGFKAINLL